MAYVGLQLAAQKDQLELAEQLLKKGNPNSPLLVSVDAFAQTCFHSYLNPYRMSISSHLIPCY